MKHITYEVSVLNPYGSDVDYYDDIESAKAEAERWAKSIKYKYPVIVVKVETEEVFRTTKLNKEDK